jgi:hypothetical protein
MNANAVQVVVASACAQPDDPVQVRNRQAFRRLGPPPVRAMNVPHEDLQP